MKKIRIFIAVPSYDHKVFWYTNISCQTALNNLNNIGEVTVKCEPGSLLAHEFNKLWCMAINGKYDYFAMLHADCHPDPGWLSILIKDMVEYDADVVSSVIAIKDGERNSSTAIGEETTDPNAYAPARIVRYIGLDDLPERFTFGFDDLPTETREGGKFLMVNTGCFVANISRLWARRVWFHIISWTRDVDGVMRCGVLSEDWYWSWQLWKHGCKVLATNKFNVKHYGPMFWDNQPHQQSEEAKQILAERT